MAKKMTIEDIYVNSHKKLRTSFPKTVIFLGAAFLVWIFGITLLIPLGQGVTIYDIEVSRIINLLIIFTILFFIFVTFREVRVLASAIAGFVTYYIGNHRNVVDMTRVTKLERTFKSLSYVILLSLIFLMFRPVLDGVHPALAGIFLIIIAIWAIVSLYGVVLAMSSEIEQAADSFTKSLEKSMKKRRRR